MNKKLVGVIWFPHAGGRWFCRSLMGNHSNIFHMAFAHPWNFYSDNFMLGLDKTSQVHKVRSLPELKDQFEFLKNSLKHGKIEGLKHYYSEIKNSLDSGDKDWILGEICMGAPIPEPVEIEDIISACPEMKIIHLIRDPVDSFPSFANRFELDGDSAKVGGLWATYNAMVRLFFENNPSFQDQYLQLKYEDLVNDIKPSLERVCRFLGIHFEDSMISETGKIWGKNTRDKVNNKDQSIIKELTKSEYIHYYSS